jgi:hypothetical protein
MKRQEQRKGIEEAEGEMEEEEARRRKNKRRTKGGEMYIYDKQTES